MDLRPRMLGDLLYVRLNEVEYIEVEQQEINKTYKEINYYASGTNTWKITLSKSKPEQKHIYKLIDIDEIYVFELIEIH